MSELTSDDAATNQRVSASGAVLLIVLSVALCLLALFQWMELLAVLEGREALCSISQNVDCAKAWQSAFATRIHDAIGMPIAGLGLVYGLTCLGLSLTLVYRALAGQGTAVLVAAVRITALLGVLTCVTLGVASARTGIWCPACIATYALTLGFAVVAARLLPGPLQPSEADLKPALIWAGGFAVAAYLVLLYPGLHTQASKTNLPPQAAQNQAGNPQQQAGADQGQASPLTQFIEGLSAMERKALADDVNAFRLATAPEGASRYPTRFMHGPTNAPVHITDFTDIKCSHCRVLEETMKAIDAAVAPGSYSIEPRYFPLDSECNKAMKQTPGDGVRCAAARAEACLEGSDFFWHARGQMFEEQDTLTKDRVIEIASQGPLSREKLLSCMAAPETQKKIDDDVDFALLYKIDGTPLVLINDRVGSPYGGFLYTVISTGGNLSSPELKPLFATTP